MSREEPNLARLAALSDAIFAVVMTIMVLDLRPPPVKMYVHSSSCGRKPPAIPSVTSSSQWSG